MATTLFKDTTYSVFGLVEDITQGEVALPDIQRPFVWGAAKVRDLLDSMYKGFPVGYLLFWETGVEAGARQIGVDAKEQVPRLLIVDGQVPGHRSRKEGCPGHCDLCALRSVSGR